MRYSNILLVTAAALIMGCGSNGGNSVDLTIVNAEGQVVTFNKRDAAGMIVLDSAVVGSSGKVTFKLPPLPLDFYQIVLDGNKQCAVALDSNDHLSLRLDGNEFDVATDISGSAHTAKFHEWYAEMKNTETELAGLKKDLNENPGDKTLLTHYNQLNKEYYENTKKFIEENPGSPVVLAALNKLNFQSERDLYKSAVASLSGTMGSSMFFKQLDGQLQRFEQQEETRRKQKEQQEALAKKVPIGELAPDFTQKTPSGEDLSLSDLKGKVVLVDFWASWCKPCRRENPNVVRMYNKYKNKGFDILSVSLDRTKPAWEAAIKKDNMTWHHVSDLRAWQNAAAQLYGVQSVPFTVLLDKNGVVIEKNLRGPALEKKLEELFGA